MRPLEHMGHFERKATPLVFCRYLVDRVMKEFGCERVAVLWVERRSHYWKLWSTVDVWGRGRDARLYDGPYPIIAHPLCGPWGNYKAVSKESRDHGIKAMELVHKWGGVVEQPVGSSLFDEYGNGGTVEIVNQSDYGHKAIKRTALYWFNPNGPKRPFA